MNLSNKLTFHIVFAVLFAVGIIFAPAVMAAENGPTATIVIDDSPAIGPGPDGDIDMVGDNTSADTTDGDNVLLTNTARTELAAPGETGNFRVKVTFSEPVFADADQTDVDAATLAAGDLGTGTDEWGIVAGAVVGGTELSGISISSVSRVDTRTAAQIEAEDPATEVWSKTEFLVTLSVSHDDTPLVLTLTLNADAVFGVGTAFRIVNGVPQAAVPGIGSQEASKTFTIIPKTLLRPNVAKSKTKIGLDEDVRVTLTFSTEPADADKPRRADPIADPAVTSNFTITNGFLVADDPDTTDVDEGLLVNSDKTEYTFVIVPQGGIGDFFDIELEAVAGAPFILSAVIKVDSRPLSQRIDITTDSNAGDRKGGVAFTVKIEYTVAPSANLTAAGVTVTDGTKGTFNRQSSTVYTLVIDPDDPAPGATGRVTVSVGQYSQNFSIPGADVDTETETETDPGDVTSRVTSDSIEIPKNSFVVVVRDATLPLMDADGVITKPVPDGQVFRTGVNKVAWSAPDADNVMPDLRTLFDRNAPGGGGALIVEDAAGDSGTIGVGRVGISEIMWGIDEGKLGDEAGEKASQWIELHNISSTDVTVTLTSLTGREITEESAITGSLSAPTIDVVTNFFDNRPGFGAWDVPGANGNSLTGGNFTSMSRILPDKKSAYADADGARYSNRDGRNDGHWSTSDTPYIRRSTIYNDVTVIYEYHGTPGQVNSFRPETQPHLRDSRTSVSSNKVIINEVANRANAQKQYEWIELRNVSSSTINLRKYRISKVTSNSSDQLLIDFPNDDKTKIGAGQVLLLVASNPATDLEHPLLPGRNVDKTEAEHLQHEWNSPVRYKVISFQNNGLPDDGKFVLIVRRPDNAAKNDHAELGANDLDKIEDIAGWDDNLSKSNYSNSVSSTELWPLKAFKVPLTDKNSLKVNTVHRRQHVTTNDGRSGVGGNGNRTGDGDAAFRDVGFTGVGYKRRITSGNMFGGTPGYDNGTQKSSGSAVTSPVYISEFMYADGPGGALPQWIELRNPSKTVGVNLHNWRLTIINHDSIDAAGTEWQGKPDASILLNNLKLDPNSTVLITSARATRSQLYMPSADVFVLYPTHRSTFGMTGPGDDIFNLYGFTLTLHTKGNEASSKWELVDEISNLAARRTAERGERTDTERYDPPRWAWPDAHTAEGDRISLARANDVMNDGSGSFTSGISDGTEPGGWILSNADGRTERIDLVYYGNKDDISTPGQTVKSPLPVNLSSFRPALENGEVVIRWTTESELDNAGFNVYRSEIRDGEFEQVNAELIQGAGTTGERNTYKWVDASAKPDAVYYYQIEDVSFAGERQMLATTKLKGLLSAKNKLTTTWGDLKLQD